MLKAAIKQCCTTQQQPLHAFVIISYNKGTSSKIRVGKAKRHMEKAIFPRKGSRTNNRNKQITVKSDEKRGKVINKEMRKTSSLHKKTSAGKTPC